MQLYQDEFVTVIFEIELSILTIKWIVSEGLSQSGFREIIIKEADLIENYKPLRVLIDTGKFDFKIKPETQDWINLVFTEKIIDIGVQRLAFVASPSPIAQNSIEETMKEAKSGILNVNYFKDEKLAREWLLMT